MTDRYSTKRPTGQAACAADAVNIGRRVGRATFKRGGRVSSERRNRSSHGLATGPVTNPDFGGFSARSRGAELPRSPIGALDHRCRLPTRAPRSSSGFSGPVVVSRLV
jgi:hypothetical protein